MIRPVRFLGDHPKAAALVAAVLLATSGAAMAYTVAVSGHDRTDLPDRRITIQQAAAALLSEGLNLTDTDLDGLPDLLENYIYGSDPNATDTSGGGVPDGWLARYGFPPAEPGIDSRRIAQPPHEDLPDVYEGHWPVEWRPTLRQIYEWDRPNDWNESLDGPFDNGLDPRQWDNSGNGIPDGWLMAHGLSPTDGSVADRRPTDDSLTVRENFLAGTDPRRADTDEDGLPDGDELNLHGSDPRRPSTGGHGVPDGWLVRFGLDPSDSSIVLQDPGGKGMTIGETFEYNRQRFGQEATIGGAGLHPTHASTVDGPIPDAWFVKYGLDPLDAGPTDAIEWKASDWPDVRNLDDGPQGADAIPDLEWSLFDKYAYDRPDGWDEATQGPWWGGLSPTDEDTDGDGLPDIVEERGWYILRRTSVSAAAEAKPVVVASDPRVGDSDGDGLTDLEEYEGKAVRDDVERTFPRTDPQNRDTAFSLITDGDKVLGTRVDGIEYGQGQQAWNLDPTSASSGGGNVRDGTSLSYWHTRYLQYQNSTSYEFPASAYASVDQWIANVTGDAAGPANGIADLFRPDGDLDGDGELNLMDGDSDNDELADGWELDPSLLKTSGFFEDPDAVDDRPRPPTDPANPDTDGDGLPDAWEVKFAAWDEENGPNGGWNLNPARQRSYDAGPADGQRNLDGDFVTWFAFKLQNGRYQAVSDIYDYNNLQEKDLSTNPNLADEDFDGVTEGWRTFWGRIYPGMVRQASDDLLDNHPAPEDLVCTGQGVELCIEATLSNIKGERLDDLTLRTFAYVRFVEAPSPEAVQLNAAFQELIPQDGFHNDVQVLRDGGLTTASIARVEGVYPLTAVASAALRTNPYLDDTDGDGLPDAWEARYGCIGDDGTASPSPIRDDRDADPDGDGLSNADEFDLFTPGIQFATDPCSADTDLGGLDDGFELTLGLDPLDPEDDRTIENSQEDFDDDRIPDAEELFNGLNPFTPDTDGDGLLDSAGDLVLETDDPVAVGFRDAGIAHRDVPNANPPQQKFLGDLRADEWDTSGDGVPDGWLRYHDFRADSTAPIWAANAYEHGKPSWWEEDVLGAWWWGRDPRNGDSDGDSVLDVDDHDLDGDGLNDANGEDPVPYASQTNAIPIPPTTRDEAISWGDCPGNPLPCRKASTAADYDGDGVPDADDRAPTVIIVDSVAGTASDAATVTVSKGIPFTVTGSLTVDCFGTGSFDCGPAPPPLAARPVFVAFTSHPDQILGVATTDATGRFDIEACVCTKRAVDVAPGVPVLGDIDGEVEIDTDPASLPLATDKRLRVWTYNTTNTFYGDGDQAADADHPQHVTIEGSLDGQPFVTHATAASVAKPAIGVDLEAESEISITAPAAVDHGSPFEGSLRLADKSGTPLASRSVELTWTGTTPPATLTKTTDDDGTATFTFSSTASTPGIVILHADYDGEPLVTETSATHDAFLVFPTTLTLEEPATDATGATGDALRIAGHVGRDGGPVPNALVSVSIAGIPVAEFTTSATGRFAGQTNPLPPLPAGAHDVVVAFDGSTTLRPSDDNRTITLHERSSLAITEAPSTMATGDRLVVTGILSGSDESGLSGHEVAAFLDDTFLASATTRSDGTFRIEADAPSSLGIGTRLLRVQFNGTSVIDDDDAVHELVLTSTTRLDVDDAVVARNAPAPVRGTLSDGQGEGIAGQPLTISWNGEPVATAVTDANGTFRKTLPATLTTDLGTARVAVHFTPGQANLYAASSDVATFYIRTGSQLDLHASEGTRQQLHLTGTLHTTEEEPIADKAVTVRVSDENTTVTTNASGHFRADLRQLTLPVGPVPWSASFDGNDTLAPVTQNANATLQTTTTTNLAVPADAGRGATVNVSVAILEDDERLVEAPARIAVNLGDEALGTFDLDGLPGYVHITVPESIAVGTTELRVDYEGDEYRHASHAVRSIDIKEAAILTVETTVDRAAPGEPVAVLFTLTDATGAPIPNATVGVAATTSPLPFEVTLDAQGQGRVDLPAPADGVLDVQATYLGSDSFASTSQSRTVPVRAPATALEAAVTDTPALVAVPLAIIAALSALSLLAAGLLARRSRLLDQALDRVIHRLEAGDSYSAAVLLAYKRLTVYLRRFGFTERPGETTDEFFGALARTVPIDEEQATILADLFDHARYNPDAALGPRERLRASGAFRKLRRSIERVVRKKRHGGTPA